MDIDPRFLAIALVPVAYWAYAASIAGLYTLIAKTFPEGRIKRALLFKFEGKSEGVVCLLILIAFAILVATAQIPR